MKKQFVIFLFLLVNFTVNAQDQKEVKNKLVAFIKEHYEIKKVIALSSTNTQDFEEKSYKNFILNFSNENTFMTFNYDYQFEYNDLMTEVKDFYTIKNKIVIDFSTIESITLKTVTTLNKNKQFFMLHFKTKPNNTITKYSSEKDKSISKIPEKLTEIAIPVNTNCCEDNNFKEVNNQIQQVFNELRKLCNSNNQK